jgi:hypothetical protein
MPITPSIHKDFTNLGKDQVGLLEHQCRDTLGQWGDATYLGVLKQHNGVYSHTHTHTQSSCKTNDNMVKYCYNVMVLLLN